MKKNKHAVLLARLRSKKKRSKATRESIELAAAVLGRSGGLIGGPARAEKLSDKRRSQIAKLAADIRWGNLPRENPFFPTDA